MIKIVLYGSVLSKKNSQKWHCKFGYPKEYKTPEFKKWYADAWKMIRASVPKKPVAKCEVSINFYFPNDVRCDLSNRADSIMDLLTEAKIIEDDRHQVVESLLLFSHGVDKKNPRAEITINNYE